MWQRITLWARLLVCSVLQKLFADALCLVPGNGAALGPETWEMWVLYFCNRVALRMNVWQEAWPERNCFLDRIIHSQTAVVCGESTAELCTRGQSADEFGREF
jgi:hypothetical protein